jgi:hypothetical protein
MKAIVNVALKALLVLFLSVFGTGCSDTVDGDLPLPVNTTQTTNPTDDLPDNMVAEELVSITTSLNKTTVLATEWAVATCIVKDSKGQTAEVNAVLTGSSDLIVEGLKASSSVAGKHEVRCTIPNVKLDEFPAFLQVTPAAPQAVGMNATPEQPVYELGDIVALTWTVTDQYGNVIDGMDGTLSGPTVGVKAVGDIADRKFQFVEEGLYTFTVTLLPPYTAITDSIELIVDGTGPVITIKTPARGQTLVGLGQPIEVVGTVEDAIGGVSSVKLNGKDVAVDLNGSFVSQVTPQWGMNLVQLEATDSYGNLNKVSPSYHYAHSYQPFLEKDAQGVSVENGVELLLGQTFLDNGIDDAGEARDLAGILEVVLGQSDVSVLLQNVAKIHKEWPVFNKVWPIDAGDLILNGQVNLDVTIADTSDIGPTSVSIESRKGGIDTTIDIGTDQEDALLLDLNVDITFPVTFSFDMDGILITSEAVAGTSFVVGARIDRLTLKTAIDMAKKAGEDMQVTIHDLDMEIVGLQIDPIKDLELTFELSFPILGDISVTLPISDYVDLNDMASAILDPLTEQLLPSLINFAEPLIEYFAGDIMADFIGNLALERTLTLPSLSDAMAPENAEGDETVALEGKKIELFTNLTSVQFDDIGAQIGLGLGAWTEKGIQRSPLGAIRRDGCFADVEDTLTYSWERAFGLGMKTDSLNATLFAIWWSGFLNDEFDLGTTTEGLDLGLSVTDTKLEMSWLLPPVLNDCAGAKLGPKLQVGDLQIILQTKINGNEITAKIFVDFSSAVDFKTTPNGLELVVTELDAIEIEVIEVSQTMLGVLHLPSFFGSKLTEWLPSQLEGKSFGPYNVPDIGFADLMPGLPEGVSMELGNLSVENSGGYTTFSADMK